VLYWERGEDRGTLDAEKDMHRRHRDLGWEMGKGYFLTSRILILLRLFVKLSRLDRFSN